MPDTSPQTAATAESALNSVPLHSDYAESQRQRHTRERLAVLSGTWHSILQDRILRLVGSDRFQAMPPAGVSTNPFAAICRDLGCLYDGGAPDVTNPAAARAGFDVSPLTRLIERAGFWSMQQAQQRYVLGLREMLVHVSIDERGQPLFLYASPDQVVARVDPSRPDVPVRIEWVRPARVDVGAAIAGEVPVAPRDQWTLWVWDVSDQANPYHRVYALRNGLWKSSGVGVFAQVDGVDVTAQVLGATYDGDAYPYRRAVTERQRRAAEYRAAQAPSDMAAEVLAEGLRPVAVLPWVVYHASRVGARVFSAYDEMELYDGTLDVAAAQSFVDHVFADASWPQRVAVGAIPVGGVVAPDDAGHARHIPTDPSSILILQKLPDFDGQPMLHQYQAGADVGGLQEVVHGRIQALATNAGVPPSDVQRLGSTAKSGVAIALSQGSKREVQRRFAPVFRDADERLVALVATLWNRWAESAEGLAARAGDPPPNYPEAGYEVRYASVPLSPQEREARRKDVLERLAAGLVSKVDAYAELNDVSTEEAAVRLAAMDAGVDARHDARQDRSDNHDDNNHEDLRDEVQSLTSALEAALSADLPAAAREALDDALAQARALLAEVG